MRKFYLLLIGLFVFSGKASNAQCNVDTTVNTFYRFLDPNGADFYGFLCSSIDSVGTTGLAGYYDGSGFSVKLIAGTQVTFFIDSCNGNQVSLTIVDSANVIIAGAFAGPACNNTLDFTATYTGTYSVVMNLNGTCGGAGTNLIGQVYVKIKTGTTAPACSGLPNDTICGALRLFVDSVFLSGNTDDAYPTDPMDSYLQSIGATICSPPNNTVWYYLQSPVNLDTVNVWVTSGAGSLFHSWIVGLLADDTTDFCHGNFTFLGCNPGAADELGIDTISFQAFGIQANKIYVFMIDGFNGGAGPYSIGLKSQPHTTSVNEITSDAFNIYPNPASDVINISTSKFNGEAKIFITDVLGKNVFMENVNDIRNYSISVNGISPGIYFVSIQIENSFIQKKVVITSVY